MSEATPCRLVLDYRRRDRTPWGAWLACASMLVPACCRMLSFVNFVISDAISTSRIRDSDAVRFSWYVARLFRRCSRRFWTAPKFARAVETFLMAVSTVSIVERAPVASAVLAAEALARPLRSDRPPDATD